MQEWTYWVTFVVFITTMVLPTPISPQQQDTTATSKDFNRNSETNSAHLIDCSELRLGQFLCNNTSIDPATQQLPGCSRETWHAKISCQAVDGLVCKETGTRNFFIEVPCKWTNGYKLDTALLLSVFLGILGADRFYLGHLGMGALKFCTMGFLFVGQLVDIILLATQQIGPKDNSSFIVGYYGPGVTSIRADNQTYIVTRPDWFQ